MTLATALLRPSISWRSRGAVWLMLQSHARGYATPAPKQSESSLSTAKPRAEISADVKPIGERIKENTKTASYTGVIVLGIGVTGFLFYTVFRELFSSSSANSVYSAALEKCINDPRVQDALGAPIKGYGEETSRRRRRHVAHSVYQKDGVNHMRMQFYIQGIRNKATVHLEMKENSAGSYDYRYIFVQLDHYPKTTIILEDNRGQDPQKNAPLPSLY
ncbi:mitochondrial import inner membrane translocase subunit Tim21-like [Lutzomyia longipalpis]|uniref:mitochondrial import inner membrane translocase subunit Tim21-like n=1 Tax=Lutzomyia longipalpis TaxID=7200 RepID=UPI002483DE49|nr:mitochondrial import inner membrane translocase subunit Tim21-like [Lutzomyia longipalpis]